MNHDICMHCEEAEGVVADSRKKISNKRRVLMTTLSHTHRWKTSILTQIKPRKSHSSSGPTISKIIKLCCSVWCIVKPRFVLFSFHVVYFLFHVAHTVVIFHMLDRFCSMLRAVVVKLGLCTRVARRFLLRFCRFY